MKTKTQKIILSGLLASLCCVATMIIKIPSPLKGYMNLGDAIVLLCGWILPAPYGFLAAGIGSALADVFSGYVIYAPATFVIKGLMALSACLLFNFFKNKCSNFFSRIITAVTSELIMIFGYYIFEGFMYGFIPSLVNMPANIVQAVAGIIVGMVLIKVFEKEIKQ